MSKSVLRSIVFEFYVKLSVAKVLKNLIWGKHFIESRMLPSMGAIYVSPMCSYNHSSGM